jgi:Fur family transcriptional regulator, ferric uptake regulator
VPANKPASHPAGVAVNNGVAPQLAPSIGSNALAISTDGEGPSSLDGAFLRCRDLGMRLSRQRKMVLSLLWDSQDHLSARDIFEQLNAEGRAIGHTSVYQNLEALQSAGVIECLDRASGRLYGYRSDPHSHLTCSDSGAILDLDIHLPADLIARIEALTGFEIESYTLQLTGHRR